MIKMYVGYVIGDKEVIPVMMSRHKDEIGQYMAETYPNILPSCYIREYEMSSHNVVRFD